MKSPLGLTAKESDAFRKQVLARLSGLDDVRIAVEANDLETATRLAIDYGDDLRLIEDLGWADNPDDGSVELTMPPSQLCRLLARHAADANAVRALEIREEEETRSEAEVFRERARLVTAVCDRVLAATKDGIA